MSIVFLLGLVLLWAGLYLLLRRVGGQVQQPVPVLARFGPFAAEVVAATGLLALATVGFFWQIIFTDNSWLPAGGGDLAPFLYPNYRFAAHYLKQGNVPLWNPHLYSGAPFAADIQSGLFYPVNLAVFLLVTNLSYRWLEYLAIFHFWLAGATMYIFLRLQPVLNGLRLPVNGSPSGDAQSGTATGRLAPLAAFAGALTFAFSDLFIVHFGNLNMIAVAAWLPLILLLFQHSLSRRSAGLAAASGAVLAIATLAGHIQITLFILLTLGLYAVWWAATPNHHHDTKKKEPPTGQREPDSTAVVASTLAHRLKPLLSPFLAFGVTLLVTVGLSALLLLPAYEMSRYTPRAELPYSEAARYSLHPAQLVGLVVPNYFGRDPALHWGPWERVETGYIGLLPLLLAIIGMLLYPGRAKGFFIGLGLLGLLLALGGYSLLHGWLYFLAPGFSQLRAPARFILLLDFALAALAATGLDLLLRQPWTVAVRQQLQKIIRASSWILAGLIIVAGPLSYYALLVTQDRNPVIFNRAAGAAAGVATFVLFAVLSLAVLHLILNGWLRGRWGGLATIAIIGLDLFTLGHNVDVGLTDPTAGFDHPEAIAFLQNDPNLFRIEVTTDVWHLWQPNTALITGLYDVWGLYNPLTLSDTTLYWSGAPPRQTGRYNFLGPKYIIASKAGAPADGNIVPIFDADPDINIYLNQDALARVLFVGQSLVVASHDDAWEAIRADGFDPAKTVILEAGQPVTGSPDSELALLNYGIENVTVAVRTDQPGYLVLSDAFYPGWQASIDDQPTPIQRANYAFRAVYVPSGEHTVQFLFKPLVWRVGLVISGLTVLILTAWAGWRWKKSG